MATMSQANGVIVTPVSLTNGQEQNGYCPLEKKKKMRLANGNSAFREESHHQNGFSGVNGVNSAFHEESHHQNGVSGVNGVNGVATNGEAKNGSAEGDLLNAILDIVLKEKLVTGIDRGEKVVDFKQPKELKSIVDLTISHDGYPADRVVPLVEEVVRYSVKTQHPYFFNQLYGGIDEVALAGSWLTEALNTNQYTFEVAPVFIMVEHYIISQLISIFGWESGDGIFAPGGSISNMYGMVLARYRNHPDVKCKGIFGRKPLITFTSDQSHYSIGKSASWLGLGMDNVVTVPSDDQGRMLPKALKAAIAKARDEGGEPFFVNATAGTTVLGAYDPIDELADICEEEKVWLHVDACWGGSAIISKKYKHFLAGINRADSAAWNPHKMLGASLQCSVFLTKHKGLLHECNSARATYLFQQDKYYDASYDTGDKSIQCGRKVDAFKLWVFMKLHGLSDLESRVDQAFDLSRYLTERVKSRPGFRLVAEPQCTNVCFWYIPPSLRGQEETGEWWVKLSKVASELKKKMVLEGTMMIGYQPLANKRLVNFIRMVITCSPSRTRKDMDYVLDEIERLGANL
ncbi:cysteine sulfinic acid decarboxylase-like [Palaemon carinicauda]|uniref:cysteine sulfinic acid decarboxylase-like n=1 Tax=Palaemon carinicauda TaxID=392227 RepID=UPI0035B5D450